MGLFWKTKEEKELELSIERLRLKIERLQKERDEAVSNYETLWIAANGLKLEGNYEKGKRLVDYGRDLVYGALHRLYVDEMNSSNWSRLTHDFLMAWNNEKILEAKKEKIQKELDKLKEK